MTKILLIAIAVFAVLALVFFFLWRLARENAKKIANELSYTQKELNEAIVYQTKLESSLEIMKKNREEADAKIESLNTGNVLDNALDELSKH